MWMLKPKTKSLKLPASQNFIYVLCVCGCESCNLWKRSLELQSNYTSRYYRTCMKCRRWQHQLSHVLFECLTWIGVLYCFWNNDEQLLPHIQRHISCGQSNSRGLFWFWRWLLPSLCCHFNNFNTQSQKNGLFRTHFKAFLMTFSHRANGFNGHFGYENVGLIMWASKQPRWEWPNLEMAILNTHFTARQQFFICWGGFHLKICHFILLQSMLFGLCAVQYKYSDQHSQWLCGYNVVRISESHCVIQ